MIVPMPPMKLMMPLACERYCRGGDIRHQGHHRRAPEGHAEQQACWCRRRTTAARPRWGIKPKASAPIGAPIRMNGMRRPIGVRRRSDQAPTGGWMNSAAMLSSVMKKPIMAGEVETCWPGRWDESVIHAPDDAHAEETKTEQENLAVVELHWVSPSSLIFFRTLAVLIISREHFPANQAGVERSAQGLFTPPFGDLCMVAGK